MTDPLHIPLSFSLPEMRPYIEAGIRTIERGLPPTRLMSPFGRVKRQTLRAVGEQPAKDRYARAVQAQEAGRAVRLRLWWKSRRPDRQLLGDVPLVRISRIEIRREGEHLRLSGDDLPTPEVFARFDGFENAQRMKEFFFAGEHASLRVRRLWRLEW